MKIRDRVAREKHRQLRNVEEIKKKELLSWKEQHVNNTMADYYYCLSNVGDAHVAAERENELTKQLNEQQRENRKIAAMRGRNALQKERLKNVKKNERVIKRKPKSSFVRKNAPKTLSLVRDEENDKVLSDEDDENQLSGSADENVDPVHDNSLRSPDKTPNELAYKPNGVVRFSQVSDLIEERRRARNLCDQIMDNVDDKPKTFSKSPEPSTKTPQKKPLFVTKSTGDIQLHAPKSPKIVTKTPIQKSPKNAKRFVPKTQQFSRVDKTTSGNRNIISQRSAAMANSKKVNTPSKPDKTKNFVGSSKSPQRQEFVPRFTKNPTTKPGILKNKAAPVITETTATGSPEKVQFYDHFSRYGKEYDALPGLVTRESHRPTVNANEAAKVQNELDEIRFQQLQELR